MKTEIVYTLIIKKKVIFEIGNPNLFFITGGIPITLKFICRISKLEALVIKNIILARFKDFQNIYFETV